VISKDLIELIGLNIKLKGLERWNQSKPDNCTRDAREYIVGLTLMDIGDAIIKSCEVSEDKYEDIEECEHGRFKNDFTNDS